MFVPNCLINTIASLVQIKDWRRPGDKQLSEPMMVSLRTHICVTRPQRDNQQWLSWHQWLHWYILQGEKNYHTWYNLHLVCTRLLHQFFTKHGMELVQADITLRVSGNVGRAFIWDFYCITWICHGDIMKMLATLLALCEGNPPVAGGFHSQRASKEEKILCQDIITYR